MKKTLVALMIIGSCSMGADLVAEWDGFKSLTSTVGGKSYTLNLTESACSVYTDGVLSVSHSGNASTATIDLTSAGLMMDTGVTISLTLSNLAIEGGNGTNPAGIFGLATSSVSDFGFLAAFDDNNSATSRKYTIAYNGSTGNVQNNSFTKPVEPTGDSPVIITLTILDNRVDYYVNGDSIGTATLKSTKTDGTNIDITADVITTLSLGSWVGDTVNSRASAKFYDLAVYNGAMTANEVKALVVPEPTTATLSLLALAGLAARRRRR